MVQSSACYRDRFFPLIITVSSSLSSVLRVVGQIFGLLSRSFLSSDHDRFLFSAFRSGSSSGATATHATHEAMADLVKLLATLTETGTNKVLDMCLDRSLRVSNDLDTMCLARVALRARGGRAAPKKRRRRRRSSRRRRAAAPRSRSTDRPTDVWTTIRGRRDDDHSRAARRRTFTGGVSTIRGRRVDDDHSRAACSTTIIRGRRGGEHSRAACRRFAGGMLTTIIRRRRGGEHRSNQQKTRFDHPTTKLL